MVAPEDTALRLAGEHPESMLPCPRCAASVKGRNLAEHIRKKHPGAPREPDFGRLVLWDDGTVSVVTRWLRRTKTTKPQRIETGRLEKTVSTSVMTSYHDDYHHLADQHKEKKGDHLTLDGQVSIGCGVTTNLRSHWDGLGQGQKRKRADVMVGPDAFVALQYFLVEAGLLSPRRT